MYIDLCRAAVHDGSSVQQHLRKHGEALCHRTCLCAGEAPRFLLLLPHPKRFESKMHTARYISGQKLSVEDLALRLEKSVITWDRTRDRKRSPEASRAVARVASRVYVCVSQQNIFLGDASFNDVHNATIQIHLS